ncbi:MAG: SDR family oxidoreductase [Chitinophagaceae bacterium]|nr:SDR family oxidoreductase [Oligoflexus sp.]
MKKDPRIALVTGANKGIGKEIAQQLAQKGLTVFIGCRDQKRGEAAALELRLQGGDVRVIALDVTDAQSIETAARRLQEECGHLDVLINNAGISVEHAPPSAANAAKMRETFDTNFFGAVATTQAMLPLLRLSAHKVIVNVSSELGSSTLHSVPEWAYAGVNLLSYNASKAALNSFTVLLAKELRSEGFRVNSINPGYVATDLNHHRGKGTAAEGAVIAVKAALLGPDGPTGSFLTEGGTLPW